MNQEVNMSSLDTTAAKTSRFKIGWAILLITAALVTLMHFGLTFVMVEIAKFPVFCI